MKNFLMILLIMTSLSAARADEEPVALEITREAAGERATPQCTIVCDMEGDWVHYPRQNLPNQACPEHYFCDNNAHNRLEFLLDKDGQPIVGSNGFPIKKRNCGFPESKVIDCTFLKVPKRIEPKPKLRDHNSIGGERREIKTSI